jgi:hypothetical protein
MIKKRKMKDKMAGFNECLDCKVASMPQAVPLPASMVAAIMGNLMVDTPQKKETTMYKDERTEAQQAKDYLISSLDNVIRQKETEAYEAFNLDYCGPKNFGELRAAVKEGWVQVDPNFKDVADNMPLGRGTDYLLVRDPAKAPDREGYDAAKKEIRKEASEVKDQIVVMGPEKGLEALNAFKAKTFH